MIPGGMIPTSADAVRYRPWCRTCGAPIYLLEAGLWTHLGDSDAWHQPLPTIEAR